MRVSFIDVGKGDCILLQLGESAALIDTGYESTSGKVVSYLRESGVSQLEFVIVTHYDRDHIGGLRAIGGAFAIGALYLPAYEGADKNYRSLMSAVSDLGLRPQRVTEPLSLTLGGASLTVLPSGVAYIPDAKGDEGNDNDLSLVAALSCNGDSFLFTGDLEKDGTEAYLRTGGLGRFDVLKVPCHGVSCHLAADLLESVQPSLAVITDGAKDPADKKTLKLLSHGGIQTYRTSTDGTIVIQGNGEGRYTVARKG